MLFTVLLAATSTTEPETGLVECTICKTIFQFAEDYAFESEEQVEAYLDKICNILPFDLFHWCDNLINSLYEELVDLLISNITPDAACAKLHLCK